MYHPPGQAGAVAPPQQHADPIYAVPPAAGAAPNMAAAARDQAVQHAAAQAEQAVAARGQAQAPPPQAGQPPRIPRRAQVAAPPARLPPAPQRQQGRAEQRPHGRVDYDERQRGQKRPAEQQNEAERYAYNKGHEYSPVHKYLYSCATGNTDPGATTTYDPYTYFGDVWESEVPEVGPRISVV